MLQPDGGWWRFPDADRLTTDGDDDGLELAEADQLSAPEIGDDGFVNADQQVRRSPIRLLRSSLLQHSALLKARALSTFQSPCTPLSLDSDITTACRLARPQAPSACLLA